jgi:transcriptional regulator of acetoin/glycerol metabolism
MHAHVAVAFESDRPLAGGLRLDLDAVDRVLVGRGAHRRCERREEGGRSTLALQVPGNAMSGTHAQLLRDGTTWTAHDLRSTNGMRVNGRPLSVHRLRAGDVLEMGHTLFVFLGEVSTPEGGATVVDLVPSTGTPVLATLIPGFERELASLGRWATTSLPVLVLGETGTGKELVARSLHSLSGRSGPWVPVNCAALPQALVESLLFGHCRGAFSGAVRDEPGLVRSAAGGTLMLDEIGDLPLVAQGALLRVLQEGEVVPVGTTRPVKVDVRVVAATHRDLGAMVAGGAFRADLLARLDGASVHLPPLRERRADIGVLVGALLQRVAGRRAGTIRFDARAALALALHAWPANVRELEQCIARAVAAADDVIGVEHLPAAVAGTLDRHATVPAEGDGEPPRLRDALDMELRAHHGNVAAVARVFRKAPAQIHRWMRRLGLDPNVYRDRLVRSEKT